MYLSDKILLMNSILIRLYWKCPEYRLRNKEKNIRHQKFNRDVPKKEGYIKQRKLDMSGSIYEVCPLTFVCVCDSKRHLRGSLFVSLFTG